VVSHPLRASETRAHRAHAVRNTFADRIVLRKITVHRSDAGPCRLGTITE
jgi:hypothetical protein